MTRDEIARAMSVATADVTSVEETGHGTVVVLSDGGRRLLRDDGVYGLDDHPATAQLRRFVPEPDGGPVADGLDAAVDQLVEAGVVAEVPSGTVDQILAWVGDSAVRAEVALEAEQAKPSPRKSLVNRLEESL